MVDVRAHFGPVAGIFGVQPDEEQDEAGPEGEHEDEVQSSEPDGFQDSGD